MAPRLRDLIAAALLLAAAISACYLDLILNPF
jgi:hypothetical protein